MHSMPLFNVKVTVRKMTCAGDVVCTSLGVNGLHIRNVVLSYHGRAKLLGTSHKRIKVEYSDVIFLSNKYGYITDLKTAFIQNHYQY